MSLPPGLRDGMMQRLKLVVHTCANCRGAGERKPVGLTNEGRPRVMRGDNNGRGDVRSPGIVSAGDCWTNVWH